MIETLGIMVANTVLGVLSNTLQETNRRNNQIKMIASEAAEKRRTQREEHNLELRNAIVVAVVETVSFGIQAGITQLTKQADNTTSNEVLYSRVTPSLQPPWQIPEHISREVLRLGTSRQIEVIEAGVDPIEVAIRTIMTNISDQPVAIKTAAEAAFELAIKIPHATDDRSAINDAVQTLTNIVKERGFDQSMALKIIAMSQAEAIQRIQNKGTPFPEE